MNKTLLFVFVLLLIGFGCIMKKVSDSTDSIVHKRSWTEIKESGEIHILTLYSSTSYFIYQGEEMGYEYELAKSFANKHGLQPVMKVATNINQLEQMLKDGEGDIVAYPIPYSLKEKNGITYCGHENITTQVLVQRKEKGKPVISDVTQLIGKDIYVEKNTKYELRLNNLNQELGGGIVIHAISKDSLTTEDLIHQVATGIIDYTLADDNVARVNKTFYNNIDIRLQISFSQRASWIVSSHNDSLAQVINQWIDKERKTPEYAAFSKRYFEKSKYPDSPIKFLLNDGRLSIYDDLFKQYAPQLDWDWRLLAAVSFEESRFNPDATSWAGARGLMQLMPNTGRRFGLKESMFTDPESNIAAGVRYIRALQRSFSQIQDPDEKNRFVLASFHAGLGHVFDAMALARKHGYNPQKWNNNVATCLEMKSNPEYFNDSIVKYGYFPGATTLEHVNSICERYKQFSQKVKK